MHQAFLYQALCTGFLDFLSVCVCVFVCACVYVCVCGFVCKCVCACLLVRVHARVYKSGFTRRLCSPKEITQSFIFLVPNHTLASVGHSSKILSPTLPSIYLRHPGIGRTRQQSSQPHPPINLLETPWHWQDTAAEFSASPSHQST
jgi:hypothetical protein